MGGGSGPSAGSGPIPFHHSGEGALRGGEAGCLVAADVHVFLGKGCLGSSFPVQSVSHAAARMAPSPPCVFIVHLPPPLTCKDKAQQPVCNQVT